MNKTIIILLILILSSLNVIADSGPGNPGYCHSGRPCDQYQYCAGEGDTICCEGTCKYKTCSEIGGETCTNGQKCSGTWNTHVDGQPCCEGTCYNSSPENQTCEEQQGQICTENQVCEGQEEQASDGLCCIGNCVDPNQETCSDLGGKKCYSDQSCAGETVPANDTQDCCIGECYNNSPPPTSCAEVGLESCTGNEVCVGGENISISNTSLTCCTGSCKTPINFYVCNQGFLYNSRNGETIDLGQYWETAAENINTACVSGFDCLPSYNDFYCVIEKDFESTNTTPASNSLSNLLLTDKSTAENANKTNIAKLINYFNSIPGISYTLNSVVLAIDAEKSQVNDNSSNNTIFGVEQNPTAVQNENNGSIPETHVVVYSQNKNYEPQNLFLNTFKNTSNDFVMNKLNSFSAVNAIIQAANSNNNVVANDVDEVNVIKGLISNLKGAEKVSVKYYMPNVLCGVNFKESQNIDELNLNENAFVCSLSNEINITANKINSDNQSSFWSNNLIKLTAPTMSLKNSYLWTTNSSIKNIELTSTNNIDLTNSVLLTQNGNIRLNARNGVNLTNTQLAAGYGTDNEPFNINPSSKTYRNLINIGETDCSSISGNPNNTTIFASNSNTQSTVKIANTTMPNFINTGNSKIRWWLNCGGTAQNCDNLGGNCINNTEQCSNILNGLCPTDKQCCGDSSVIPPGGTECEQNRGECKTSGCSAGEVPTTWACGSGKTCCYACSGTQPSNPTPVNTFITFTGFITNQQFEGIDGSVKISVDCEGTSSINENFTVTNGLFSGTANCDLIPNKDYVAKVYVWKGSMQKLIASINFEG